QRPRARRPPDRQRHGKGLRPGLSRHWIRRRAPPAPSRRAFPRIAGFRLMATAADLDQRQGYRVPQGFFTSRLSEVDPAVEEGIRAELRREQTQIELIASENIVSKAVLEAQGSVLTNKYAEGYPGRRYYQGCAPSD